MIKIAIIGAGYMAREHIRAFKDIEDVEISGIYNRTTSKAETLAQEFGINTVATNTQELFEKTKANIVVIATSIPAIAEVTIECFKFPWICLIEKPPGYNLEEALLIKDQALLNQARPYVALNRRHYSATRAVLDELKKRDNDFRIIKVCDQEDMKDPVKIGHPERIINNWMYANSIHMIDYFCIFCRGNLISVNPVVQWNPGNPKYVVAHLEFDSGDVGLYEAVWNAPSPWAVSVITSKTRWDMSPLESATKQEYGSRNKIQIDLGKWDSQFKPGLRRQAQLAVDTAKGIQAGLPTIDDAIQTMQLIKLIYSQ